MQTNNSHKTGFKTSLPSYFYNIEDPVRWFDPYASDQYEGEERVILTNQELIDKYKRNREYRAWLGRHQLKQSILRFQRIRVIKDGFADFQIQNAWWPKYYGAIFTVFLQPQTFRNGRRYLQFYTLCPEDCELLNRYEHTLKNPPLPPRDKAKEAYTTRHPALSAALVIPTKCCHHLKNETVGGKTEFAGHT